MDWKSLKGEVRARAALSSGHAHTWSLAYLLSPVCRDGFFFYSLGGAGRKVLGFRAPKAWL